MSINIHFYKGSLNCIEDTKTLENLYDIKDGDPEKIALVHIKSEFRKVLQINNLSFFLGAGCSSLVDGEGKELGIPVIKPLTKLIIDKLTKTDVDYLKDKVKINLTDTNFSDNLEKIMEVLENYKLYLALTNQSITSVDKVISKIKSLVFDQCNSRSEEVISVYESFYRKLMIRNNTLQRCTIVTPNYDLFNELSAERVGVEYCNGFSGYHDRRFNPGVFSHVYAEKIGIGTKVTTISNFVYLLKLHGSISWMSDKHSLYGVSEKSVAADDKGKDFGNMMIYPTPAKQSSSMSSPYSDLFRIFQSKLSEKENILISLGYSFSDEHINNVIYQALSSSKFRLVVFSSVTDKVKKLIKLDDPRIWVIGGEFENENIHYFKTFIEKILESDISNKKEETIKNTLKSTLG
ncbi:SIR2 family protein [Halobacteriovorax sp. ZH4_bin.1]|uniref:SIR2 family protein n=1 Tax=unclassified Halobacteriovorax TaxID=2639665 RepID=UPI003716C092